MRLSLIVPLPCVFLFALAGQAQNFQVPPLTAPVIDQTHIFDEPVRERLDQALGQLYQTKKTQIQVLVVPTLNGVPIEQASIQVTDAWKLGGKEGDRGLLILMSMQDRRVRIEVGQGLEGDIPDARAKQIISNRIIPLFKQGQFQAGLLAGVFSVAQITDPDFDFKSYFAEDFIPDIQPKNTGKKLPGVFFIIIILVILFINRFGGGGGGFRRRGWYLGGPGFGGGGFGGGSSWGGGGGGFSGGGASGDW